MVTITEEIANAFRQQDRPLELHDAAGAVYYVLTERQFRRYIYDDSDLTADEMIAAASCLDNWETAVEDQKQADGPS